MGWHRRGKALAMAAAYRLAMPPVETEGRAVISLLAIWLDGFVPWPRSPAGSVASADLVSFWAD